MLPKYKRILLKLSGESLMGNKSYGLDPEIIAQYAIDIKQVVELGVQVAIVIGGGNIYRGMNEAETDICRAPARSFPSIASDYHSAARDVRRVRGLARW